MSDDAAISQDEIEQLLRQAQAQQAGQPAAGESAPRSESPAAKPGVETPASISPGDMEHLLNQAEQALASVQSPVTPQHQPPVVPFKLQDFSGAPASSEAATLDLLRDVELNVKIELGRSQMYLEDVLKLRKGSVVPLDKLAGDPVDIYVNGRLIARGEVLVLNDNFCVRVAELVAAENAA